MTLHCHVRRRIMWPFPPAPLCLLALGFLALSGCYLPPFDEKLAESEQFAAKLTHVTRLGPVYIDDWMNEGGYFLPSREFDASASPDGYWVRQSGTDLIAAYMTSSSVHAGNHTTNNTLGDGSVAFPLTQQQAVGASASSPQRGLLCIFGNDASSGMLALGTDSAFGLTMNMDPIAISPTPSGSIVGASYRIESASMDLVSVLYQSTSSPPVFGGGYATVMSSTTLTVGGIMVPTSNDSSGAMPALAQGAFFGYHPDSDRYYVSGYRKDDGSPYSAYWIGPFGTASPVRLPNITGRIAAILSSGYLLSVGDGMMYLYGYDGTYVAGFATGGMRFAYEYFDSSDGAWYCYFTRAFRLSNDNKVFVDVYRCYTSSLKDLGS